MSEDNKSNPQDQQNQGVAQSPDGWEAQLQARAIEMLNQRISPLKSELERLQSAVKEIVPNLIGQAENDFKERLKIAARHWDRAAQMANNASFEKRLREAIEEREQEFKDKFKIAIRHWDRAAQMMVNVLLKKKLEEREEEFKERLKIAARQWSRAAQMVSDASHNKRLEEALTQAVTAARQEAEREFKEQLRQAARDWDNASQMSNEAAVQKRLEQACSEAAAVARRESEVQVEDLREQLEASRKALTLAVSSSQSGSAQSSSFDQLRAAIDEIDAQRTQSETLTALVRRAGQFAPRIVFFVVKGGDAVGWKASGFENGLNDETVRLLTVPTNISSLLQEALAGFRTAVGRSSSPGDSSAVLGLYGSPAPERAIAAPLVVRGKAAAVLYADSGTQPENSINTSAIETLMRVASMGIELLPARRGFDPPRPPAPTAQMSSAAYPAPAQAAEQPAAPAVPAPAVETTHAQSPQWKEQVRTTEDLVKPKPAYESPQETEAEYRPPAQIEAEPDAADEPDEPNAIEAEAEMVEHPEEPAIPPPPTPPTPPAPPVESFNERLSSAPTIPLTSARQTLDIPREQGKAQPEERSDQEPPRSSTFVQSPAFAAPSGASRPPAQTLANVPTPASETEQRAHNDARRFARLLVSEIKLYNAAKVNEGRRNFDLYDRLKDEIDRSRKVYDKRVSPAVAARFDYFYDELVQTLAEGDPAKLGPGCPGPVVLAS